MSHLVRVNWFRLQVIVRFHGDNYINAPAMKRFKLDRSERGEQH